MTQATPITLVLKIACEDKPGIVAAVANTIAIRNGNILESAQYFDPDTGMFFMRVCFAVSTPEDVTSFKAGFEDVASTQGIKWSINDLAVKPKVIIMVSKFGHCLNHLLYRYSIGKLPIEVTSVVSNHETYRKSVEDEGIPFIHLPVTADTKAEQEAALLKLVGEQGADLVVLARYMQVLSDGLTQEMSGRIINIHHSFLPSFKGAKPYHRAHARGVKLIGATAHYVTADLDEGPIIAQDVSRVDHTMSTDQFVDIGRDVESLVLSRAVKAHAEHRILLNEDKTIVF